MSRPFRGTCLDDLPNALIEYIMCKTDPRESTFLASTSRKYRYLVNNAYPDILSRRICYAELLLRESRGPDGIIRPTFADAYEAWHQTLNMYDWLLVARVARFWNGMKTWLNANFPEVLSTLRPGVSEDDLNEFQVVMSVTLPPVFRILYRLVDGQAMENDVEFLGSIDRRGLIGGYHFREVFDMNTYLFPLQKIEESTPGWGWCCGTMIVVAGPLRSDEKPFLLSCDSGRLYTVDQTSIREFRALEHPPRLVPCVPVDSIIDREGMLLWLEEHLRRLKDGIIGVYGEGVHRFICHFPKTGPLYMSSQSNDIEVSVSCLFVPGNSDFDADEFRFYYSVRISMLASHRFQSCELSRESWLIHTFRRGVGGEFPFLNQIERNYMYFDLMPIGRGPLLGNLKFVPGSVEHPQGEPFSVILPPFTLQFQEEYVF